MDSLPGFTTGANRKSVIDAYAMSVQVIFIKPSSLLGLELTIRKLSNTGRNILRPVNYGNAMSLKVIYR
jgi:hypothetical protein